MKREPVGQPAGLDGDLELDYRVGLYLPRRGACSWFAYGHDRLNQSYWVGDGEIGPFDSRAETVQIIGRSILQDWSRVQPL